MIDCDEKLKKYIRDLVLHHPRSYFKTIKSRKNSHILKYIEEMTPKLSDKKYLISTKVYWLINGLTDFPKCKVCGKEIRKNIKINDIYPTHCCAKCLSQDPEVQKHKEESYQKLYGEGITNPFQSPDVIRKIDETNYRKYNVRRYTQTEDYRHKIESELDVINRKKYDTHKKNSSFNESKTENIVKYLLSKKYKDIKCHYKSDEYPFVCDFYIESENLYIEYNGTWTHGGHPYDKNNVDDINTVKIWKSKGSEYYDNAIYTWTDLDVRKRNIAKERKLNLIELWSIEDVEKFIGFGKFELTYPYNRKHLEREYDYYRNVDCSVLNTRVSHKNEIVKYFQQDVFFRHEKDIWKNNAEIREKLILNRIKYLGIDESKLTNTDILTGFKKSGIYYGYSHFNPLWFGWFIRNYSVSRCYDPCGGWGHRLLGGLCLEKYIYNDLSRSTKENVDRIIEYFGIENTITYNNDAVLFNPSEKFDAMFTCPPYFNLEKYECGRFENRLKFEELIDSIFRVFKFHDECKILGIVIREDLLGNHMDFCNKILLNINGESYFNDIKNKHNEYMFLYHK